MDRRAYIRRRRLLYRRDQAVGGGRTDLHHHSASTTSAGGQVTFAPSEPQGRRRADLDGLWRKMSRRRTLAPVGRDAEDDARAGLEEAALQRRTAATSRPTARTRSEYSPAMSRAGRGNARRCGGRTRCELAVYQWIRRTAAGSRDARQLREVRPPNGTVVGQQVVSGAAPRHPGAYLRVARRRLTTTCRLPESSMFGRTCAVPVSGWSQIG